MPPFITYFMYYNSNKVIIQYLSYNFKCLKKLLLILGILQYRCEQRKVLDFIIEPVTDDKPQLHDVYLVKSGSTVGKVAIVETTERFNIWSPLNT